MGALSWLGALLACFCAFFWRRCLVVSRMFFAMGYESKRPIHGGL